MCLIFLTDVCTALPKMSQTISPMQQQHSPASVGKKGRLDLSCPIANLSLYSLQFHAKFIHNKIQINVHVPIRTCTKIIQLSSEHMKSQHVFILKIFYIKLSSNFDNRRRKKISWREIKKPCDSRVLTIYMGVKWTVAGCSANTNPRNRVPQLVEI